MSTWPEYLDQVERYLAVLGPDLTASPQSSVAAAALAPARPVEPMSPEDEVTALGVLARLEQAIVLGERRRDELLANRRRLQLRRGASSCRARVLVLDL